MNVADPRALRQLLRRHDIRAATSLGQRFLVDRAVLSAIVDAADLSADDDVLEVGPGPGVLTAALATRVRSVTAVEVDPRMVALLEETLAEYKNVRVVQADALKVDLLGLAASSCARRWVTRRDSIGSAPPMFFIAPASRLSGVPRRCRSRSGSLSRGRSAFQSSEPSHRADGASEGEPHARGRRLTSRWLSRARVGVRDCRSPRSRARRSVARARREDRARGGRSARR